MLTIRAFWYYNIVDGRNDTVVENSITQAWAHHYYNFYCHAFRMYTPLGQRLKELRTERNLTQRRLASDLNIRTVTYLRYEKSQREPPISLLVTIARYYGITVDDLLGLK